MPEREEEEEAALRMEVAEEEAVIYMTIHDFTHTETKRERCKRR